MWPGDQKIYFDKSASLSTTISGNSGVTGKIVIFVLLSEFDVSFVNPSKGIIFQF